MRVEQVVGLQVRTRRDALGLSQAQLGTALAPLLGRPWPRQAVSAAERGERSFGAAELVAFAAVLNATVGDLLAPPETAPAVNLGGPDSVPRDSLIAVVTAHAREDMNLAAINATITGLAEKVVRSQLELEQVLALARQLDGLIVQRISEGGVVSLPLAAEGVDPTPLDYGHSRKSRDGDT